MRSESRPAFGSRAHALAAAVVCFVLLIASVARSAQPPTVYHGPLGNPGPPLVHGLASGTQSLELHLEIGIATTNASQQTICVDGSGDEVCGFTVALQGSGGVSIVDFCPNNNCAPGLVHHLDSATGILRINRLGPAIAQIDTPFHLGRITVRALGDAGSLTVLSSSQAVAANLQIVSVRDPDPLAVWLPEPGLAVGLLAGVAGLAVRVRGARMRRVRALMLFALFSSVSPSVAPAQPFSDRSAFVAAVTALGSPPERLGFEAVPRSAAGFAALQQGDRLGPVALRSLSLAADVDLAFQAGFPLGLFGTLLVADPGLTGDPALHPGGTAQSGGARGNDDLRIAFDVPMRAAGLRILGNLAVAGETARFLDVTGRVVTSFVLPGSASLPGGDGFVGYVIEAGDAPISSIVIDESDSDGDDIAVDDLLFESSADSFADAVQLFSPTILAGEPSTANLDATRSLERPDGQTVSLGRGGKLVVRFDDNVLTGSDDELPDLRIFEADAELEEVLVEVSANGLQFTSVGRIAGGVGTLDLDAYGFDSSDRLRYVRIVDDAFQGAITGETVGADIDAVEALSGGWLPPDLDGDHVADDFDDCPTVYDEAQRDDDADGVGNVCDNCRHVPNPDQGPDDCRPARVRLEREFDPVPDGTGKARLASLFLDCGGFGVRAVTLGIWVPPGPASFDFGGACLPPLPPYAPLGAPLGNGCTGTGIALGPTVNGMKSGAFGVPLGDPMPASFRSDVVFVTLRGVGPDEELCSAFQSDVLLGRLRGSVPLGLSADAVASISIEDALERSWCLVEDEDGACRDQTDLVYRMTSPLPMVAEIRLQPAAGESATTPTAWDVCVDESTETFMHRVTLGLLGPVDADYPTLFLDDCLVGPNASGKRTCAGEIGVDPEAVDEAVSFTRGPLVSSATTMLPDTLYTPLDGATPGTGGINVLNPYIGSDACIGIVTNDAPPATLGAPPIPVRDGFFALDYHDEPSLGPQPYQTAIGLAIQSLDGANVYETIVFNSGDDLDDDGVTDAVDNCPFAANADQRDDGGFATTVPDGVGNACECGDANGSGRVFSAATPETGTNGTPLVPDLQRIREYLVGMHATDSMLPTVCSVHGDTTCDAADVVVLDRALQDLAPGVTLRCDAAVD